MTEKAAAVTMKAWKAGWQVVNDREIEELRKMSIESRLDHLASLFEFRLRLGDDPFDEDEIRRTRERWNLLRRRVLESR